MYIPSDTPKAARNATTVAHEVIMPTNVDWRHYHQLRERATNVMRAASMDTSLPSASRGSTGRSIDRNNNHEDRHRIWLATDVERRATW